MNVSLGPDLREKQHTVEQEMIARLCIPNEVLQLPQLANCHLNRPHEDSNALLTMLSFVGCRYPGLSAMTTTSSLSYPYWSVHSMRKGLISAEDGRWARTNKNILHIHDIPVRTCERRERVVDPAATAIADADQ